MRRLLLGALLVAVSPASFGQRCDSPGVHLQVLGSGGPELQTRRAGSSYLVWVNGKARVLVDAGHGSALNLVAAGAAAADLDVVLLSQLHVDHTSDLVALLGWSLRENRDRVLPLYGPAGGRAAPSTVAFVRDLLDSNRGAWRHLGALINPLAKGGYRLEPHDMREKPPAKIGVPRKSDDDPLMPAFVNDRVRTMAVAVNHDGIPTLAWRVDAGAKSIVFAADSDATAVAFARLAQGADIVVAHHQVSENTPADRRQGYATPTVIGQMAKAANVRQLVLSHRGAATQGREEESAARIRAHYTGPVHFADDLDCVTP